MDSSQIFVLNNSVQGRSAYNRLWSGQEAQTENLACNCERWLAVKSLFFRPFVLVTSAALLLCQAPVKGAQEVMSGRALDELVNSLRSGQVCFIVGRTPPTGAPDFIDQRCVKSVDGTGTVFGQTKAAVVTFYPTERDINVSGANAWKLRTPNLAGTWTRLENSLPASIGQTTESLTFVNEFQQDTRGHFVSNETVVAESWEGGLRGKIQQRGNKIRWTNGSNWVRGAGGNQAGVPNIGGAGGAPPPPATPGPLSFNVRAGGWASTGIHLRRGESVEIKVTGGMKWPVEKDYWGPAGHIITGGIIGYVASARVGSADRQQIGTGGTVIADLDGELQLAIPTCGPCYTEHGGEKVAFRDNDGQIQGSMTFTVQRRR